jgi:hypothetical protein
MEHREKPYLDKDREIKNDSISDGCCTATLLKVSDLHNFKGL